MILTNIIFRPNMNNLSEIDELVSIHKSELGFVRRVTLEEAIQNNKIIMCADNNDFEFLSFVHYHNRRDNQTTIYNIVVHPKYRRCGAGRALIDAVKVQAQTNGKTKLLLKCPTELPANEFYRNYGFILERVDVGKRRKLNVWSMQI